jgi:hypothetical protein
VPFPEAGLAFFDLGNLFRSEFYRMLRRFLFQFQQPFIPIGHAMLDPYVLNGWLTNRDPFQFEHTTQFYTAPGWAFQTDRK